MTTTETAINAKVHDLLQKQIANGQQLGVQVAAYKDGERIVDAWAGTFGPGDDREVQADTLFNCFSTTKGVAHVSISGRFTRQISSPVSLFSATTNDCP